MQQYGLPNLVDTLLPVRSRQHTRRVGARRVGASRVGIEDIEKYALENRLYDCPLLETDDTP